MEAVLLLLLVFVLLALRQNIIVILLGSAAYVHLVWGDGHLEYLAEDLWISLDNALLLAIPMFLLAGNVTTATVFPVISKNSTLYPSSETPGT